MKFGAYEDTAQLTKLWEGERLPDGRPYVSDDILQRMRNITLEEAWGPLWDAGFKSQFQGDFKVIHEEIKLVGRAVTGIMVPMRPDLDTVLMEYGRKEEGRQGTYNQWLIDNLQENDVVVIDLFDKIYEGTFVGGNLTTAIRTKTKQGGAVIWGGIRDIEQIQKIPDVQVYYRGTDPTGIGNVILTGINVPCRIGNAVCMPGDIVLGTTSGVIFIPPQYAEMCVVGAEKNHIRDIFGFQRLDEEVYTTAQIDTRWTVPMWEDFLQWMENAEEAKDYLHLTWDKEVEESKEYYKNGDVKPQVRL